MPLKNLTFQLREYLKSKDKISRLVKIPAAPDNVKARKYINTDTVTFYNLYQT